MLGRWSRSEGLSRFSWSSDIHLEEGRSEGREGRRGGEVRDEGMKGGEE